MNYLISLLFRLNAFKAKTDLDSHFALYYEDVRTVNRDFKVSAHCNGNLSSIQHASVWLNRVLCAHIEFLEGRYLGGHNIGQMEQHLYEGSDSDCEYEAQTFTIQLVDADIQYVNPA